MKNNLKLREPVFAIPLIHVIMNFTKKGELYCIVEQDFPKEEFYLASDNLEKMSFFGYEEQCKRQWLHFPGKIVKLRIPNTSV